MKRIFLSLILILLVASFTVQARGGQGISYYKAGFPDVAKPLLLSELTTDPSTSSETCYYLGKIYFGENKSDSALYYFNKGLTGESTNALNSIGLAMLKIKSNPKAAEQEIQSTLKLPVAKKNPDFYIAAAEAYLANGQFDDAINYREKAKNIKVKYAPLAVLSGDIELAKKDVGAACSNYEMAILYDANCMEAYIKYARAYKGVNSPLAISKLNELKAKEPSFLLADRELGDLYYSNNEFKQATEYYDNYLKSGNTSVADFTKYASSVFYSGDFKKALEVAQLGLQKSPRNPVFNRLAMYNFVSLQKYDDALKYADAFFNKSDHPELSYYDYTYYGNALRAKKQYDLAIEQFRKAYDLDNKQIGFIKNISDMYAEKLDYVNAIATYNKFVSLLPEDKINADVYLDLGKLYYNYANVDKLDPTLKRNNLLKADTLFAKVVSIEPTVYRGSRWRALANFGLETETDFGLAKPYYEQTLAIVEAKADAKYNSIINECSRYLGFYYYQKKDWVQSKVYWNKILAINPKDEVALRAIDGLDKSLKGKK